jgi:hypothetical protein
MAKAEKMSADRTSEIAIFARLITADKGDLSRRLAVSHERMTYASAIEVLDIGWRDRVTGVRSAAEWLACRTQSDRDGEAACD